MKKGDWVVFVGLGSKFSPYKTGHKYFFINLAIISDRIGTIRKHIIIAIIECFRLYMNVYLS